MQTYTLSIEMAQEAPIELTQKIAEIEKSLISLALAETGNVKAHAARVLGINRTTLLQKMRRYGFALEAPYRRGRDVSSGI